MKRRQYDALPEIPLKAAFAKKYGETIGLNNEKERKDGDGARTANERRQDGVATPTDSAPAPAPVPVRERKSESGINSGTGASVRTGSDLVVRSPGVDLTPAGARGCRRVQRIRNPVRGACKCAETKGICACGMGQGTRAGRSSAQAAGPIPPPPPAVPAARGAPAQG